MTIVERRQRWIRALRSGRYLQCEGQLHGMRNDGKWGHCCLGVAKRSFRWGTYSDLVLTRDQNRALGIDVLDMPSIVTGTPRIVSVADHLTFMNDREGATFEDIANVLEMFTEFEQYAGLL